MATKNRVAIKASIRQKVWNYIRRNRTFRFGDVMAITEVTHSYLNNMLRPLKAIGYVKEIKREKPYSSTQFVLIKCTGVQCPSFKEGILYDYNTNEEIEVEHTPVLTKLLNQMNKPLMTKQQVLEDTDVTPGVAKKWFKKLKELGVMKEIKPIKKLDGHKAFSIDFEKVIQLIADVKDGSFKVHGSLSSTKTAA